MPGAHETEPLSQMGHLGPQEMVGIKPLEFEVCLFDDIGSVVFAHKNPV
jgi:hypothetical protein